jgi:hypothetical protein
MFGFIKKWKGFSDVFKATGKSIQVRERGDGTGSNRLRLIAIDHVRQVANRAVATGQFPKCQFELVVIGECKYYRRTRTFQDVAFVVVSVTDRD